MKIKVMKAVVAIDEGQRDLCIRCVFLITRNRPEQVVHVREFVRGYMAGKLVLFGLPD